eukprot:RCo044600
MGRHHRLVTHTVLAGLLLLFCSFQGRVLAKEDGMPSDGLAVEPVEGVGKRGCGPVVPVVVSRSTSTSSSSASSTRLTLDASASYYYSDLSPAVTCAVWSCAFEWSVCTVGPWTGAALG